MVQQLNNNVLDVLHVFSYKNTVLVHTTVERTTFIRYELISQKTVRIALNVYVRAREILSKEQHARRTLTLCVTRSRLVVRLTYNVELERQTHFGFGVHLAFIDSGVSRLSKFNQQGPIVRVIRVDDLESLVTGVSQHSCRQYVQISLPHP